MTGQQYQTWQDFIAELEAKNEFPKNDQKKISLLATEWQDRMNAFFAAEEEPIISDLRAAGIFVNSVWDIVNSKKGYPEAITLLLQHLQRTYHPKVRASIARALAIPQARPYWNDILKLYLAETHEEPREALALALANSANETHFLILMELLRDKKNGQSRAAFMHRLKKFPDPKIWQLIKQLQDDPEIGIGAREILDANAKRTQRTKNKA
jgi:HEAT repeat protein